MEKYTLPQLIKEYEHFDLHVTITRSSSNDVQAIATFNNTGITVNIHHHVTASLAKHLKDEIEKYLTLMYPKE